MLLIKAAMPHLKKTEGSVLNIGSLNAYCGEGNQLAYSISKGALMTLTRNLALEETALAEPAEGDYASTYRVGQWRFMT